MHYYAVKKGRDTGIFDRWADCQKAIAGFKGAEFLKCDSKEEAEAYINGLDMFKEQLQKDLDDGYISVFVSGHHNKKSDRVSYCSIIIDLDGKETELSSVWTPKLDETPSEIMGEVYAVITALEWCHQNEHSKVKIFYNYDGIKNWVTGDWECKSHISNYYLHSYNQFDLKVDFSKPSTLANNPYMKKSKLISKNYLNEGIHNYSSGDGWFVFPYLSVADFNTAVSLIKEANENILFTERDNNDSKIICGFILGNDSITVTLHKTGKCKLLVQGKKCYLYQLITSVLVELFDNFTVEEVLTYAYNIPTDKTEINKLYNALTCNLPSDYPDNICRLLRQSIINLQYKFESEDYAQYALPAFRALEGHIKYLIKNEGQELTKHFDCFNKNEKNQYVYVGAYSDYSQKIKIENCYNYYKEQRDTSLHFGDIIGSEDTTRIINDKKEVNKIIKKCINIINENL